jgi:SSS family solute:Na+ symporter
VVAPLGLGLVGLIAAGLIGAILSSIDSMMNSAATIVTFDIYKRYVEPEASERQLIWVGRASIVVFMTLAAVLAITVIDPESKENFFLQIVDQQSHLTPGMLVAFLLGIFWRRATGTGALVAIVAGPMISVGLHVVYRDWLAGYQSINDVLGSELNMFHRLAVATAVCALVHAAISLATKRDPEKERLVWTDLGGHDPRLLARYGARLLTTLGFYVVMAVSMVAQFITPLAAGVLAAAWTMGITVRGTREARARQQPESSEGGSGEQPPAPVADDRLWAGLLCSLAIFMMFYFY